jgi:hypothetical protein
MIKGIFTLREIAQEVIKLIKYTLEMQTLTRYKGGEKANIQKLSMWAYIVMKESESENE